MTHSVLLSVFQRTTDRTMSNSIKQRPTHGGNLNWAANIAGCQPQEILDFSASINPLGPPHSALYAIDNAFDTLTAYPDPNYTGLRQAIADFHQLDREWILPGNGAAELLTWAGLDLSKTSQTLLPVPAFADYRRALQTFQVKVQLVSVWECDKWTVKDDEGLLLNNPHNPTGQLWTRSQLQPLLDSAGLVVVDEAFMDFLPEDCQESLIEWVAEYPNLVVLRSLTKFYSLPGLRLGYAISHPDRLEKWQKWRHPWSVNALATAAGIAVLGDTEFQQQTLAWLQPAKQQLWQEINEIPGLSAEWGAANFLLVKTEVPSDRLQRRLLQRRRILIRDCLSFPELGDRFFRVAVKHPSQNRQLTDALREVMEP